ncbi:oxygenase MpaB family protein [Nocardia crassostreae]|uniref:oxygenase MpaB family protein n=1 Tax=Nocardia crassostreae TaxID=53428 RepID=UPI0008325E7A|nr:oxygenase MpaB family protein [Nocardia crassostreae]
MARTEQLPEPVVFQEPMFKLAMKVLAPGDIRPTPEQRDAYRRFTALGDPLADAVVDMFRRLPTGQGRTLFEIALEQGIDAVPDAPAELRAFFAHIDAQPFWLDQGKLDLAARVCGRVSPWATNLALSMFSLNGGYLASRADKVLVGTGGLSAENMAPRRVIETATWWMDVTASGGMGRFEPGFKNTVRVRLMHAQVRAGMNRRADWDYADWDHPVNQSLTAGTLMLFSLGSIAGCQAVGLQFSRREKAAVYHLWRYVGHLIGLDPEILPADETDTWRLLWLQADYEFQPDADSRTLSEALVGALPTLYGLDHGGLPARLAGRAFTLYSVSYSRILLGHTNADFLGMPYSRVSTAAVLATAALNGALEVPRRLIPGATRLAERLGRRTTERMMARPVLANRPDRSYGRHDRLAETRAA